MISISYIAVVIMSQYLKPNHVDSKSTRLCSKLILRQIFY